MIRWADRNWPVLDFARSSRVRSETGQPILLVLSEEVHLIVLQHSFSG